MTSPDATQIRDALTKRSATRLEQIEVFKQIDSTNNYLMDLVAPRAGRCRVALAEHQTAGRGRSERPWVSAPGSSLCLSMAYTFETMPEDLPPLTLALGVNAAAALTDIGVSGIRIKWPNDILVGNSKLGGILTETRQQGGLNISVVSGIGLNISLPDVLANAVQSDWADSAVDLASVMPEPPERLRLAAAVIDAWVDAFRTYEQRGFGAFEAPFEHYDWLSGKSIVVDTPQGEFAGTATGIDALGALMIDGDTGPHKIISGSIIQVATEQRA